MSIFEWFFERNNPAPTGNFESRHYYLDWPRIWIIVAGLLSVIFVGFIIYAICFNYFYNFEPGTALFNSILIIGYLSVSYFIYPKPNTENMGIFGFIDNPFRYTDDVNRFLMWSQILLFPGKIIAIPIVNLWFVIMTIKNNKNQTD